MEGLTIYFNGRLVGVYKSQEFTFHEDKVEIGVIFHSFKDGRDKIPCIGRRCF